MATIKRESSLGKEKRGTSPSNSSITHAQRKPSTASSEKQLPNYLKPTKSSRNDAASIKNLIKKPGPEDTSQTPNLLRRRSFDRPPSAARAHKALISPVRHKPSAALVRDKPTATPRSASFSSKSTTAPKATLERVATKKPNAAKPQTLSSSRTIKKTPSPIPNPTARRGLASTSLASKKAPSSHDKKEAQNPETKHENKENSDHRVEEVVQDDQGETDDAQISKAEESEYTDVVDTTEVKSVEKGQHTADIYSIISQEYDAPQNEKVEEKIHEGKSDHTQHDEDKENHGEEEIIVGDDHREKIPHEEAKTETEDGGEEHATDEVALAGTKEIEEEKQRESRQEDDEGEGSLQGLGSSKDEMVEGEVGELEAEAEAEAEAANGVAESQVKAGHGKKESATPYNDVIEETANKLLEERKNKVRALVGAFETVIDKETSNAK